jgi:hypothetical protein
VHNVEATCITLLIKQALVNCVLPITLLKARTGRGVPHNVATASTGQLVHLGANIQTVASSWMPPPQATELQEQHDGHVRSA